MRMRTHATDDARDNAATGSTRGEQGPHMLVPLNMPSALFAASLALRAVVWLGIWQWLGRVGIGTPLASLPGPKAERVSSPGATRSGLIRPSDAVVPRLQMVLGLVAGFWSMNFTPKSMRQRGGSGYCLLIERKEITCWNCMLRLELHLTPLSK
jgi:hypothetical protein